VGRPRVSAELRKLIGEMSRAKSTAREVLGWERLHHRGHLVAVEAEPGYRRGGDNLERGNLGCGCWRSRTRNNAYFSLFSSLFFFDPPNRFVQIPRDLS
jgi:hypothetical protein